jgi:hypothetical protein
MAGQRFGDYCIVNKFTNALMPIKGNGANHLGPRSSFPVGPHGDRGEQRDVFRSSHLALRFFPFGPKVATV